MLQFVAAFQPPINRVPMTDLQFMAMFLSGIAAFGVNLIAIAVGLYKLGGAVATFKSIGEQQSHEINELKNNVVKIAQIMTDNTLLAHRVESVEKRMGGLDKLIDDLRRGEGMILPLFRGAHEVPTKESER